MKTTPIILFVDDEERVTKYFKKALTGVFKIETAQSVDAAIDILNEKHQEIAVVLTDQRMPIKQGLELLEFTQTHYPKIIRMLTTAFCDIDNAVDAINKAEVFRYIPKPWDLDKLEEALHQAIKRFHSLQKNTGSSLKSDLLTELKNDCQHWLMYAIHAYGDVNVYQSGIEALACRYHILINSSFNKQKAHLIIQDVDKILSDDFLNETILSSLQAQHDKGFGVSNLNFKSH
jgi:DNA-binding NtrC family response regulator